MNQPTISTRKLSAGSNSICKNMKAQLLPSLTIDIFLDNVAGWILELRSRRRHSVSRKLFKSWLEQKQARLAVEQKGRRQTSRKLWNANWNGFGCHRKVATPNQKLASIDYEKLVSEESHEKSNEDARDYSFRSGERLGDVVIEAHQVFPKVMTINYYLKISNFQFAKRWNRRRYWSQTARVKLLCFV